jgi:hypothetical protein
LAVQIGGPPSGLEFRRFTERREEVEGIADMCSPAAGMMAASEIWRTTDEDGQLGSPRGRGSTVRLRRRERARGCRSDGALGEEASGCRPAAGDQVRDDELLGPHVLEEEEAVAAV